MPLSFCRCFQVVAPFFLVLVGFESPFCRRAVLAPWICCAQSWS